MFLDKVPDGTVVRTEEYEESSAGSDSSFGTVIATEDLQKEEDPLKVSGTMMPSNNEPTAEASGNEEALREYGNRREAATEESEPLG